MGRDNAYTKCFLCDQLLGHRFKTREVLFSRITHYSCMRRDLALKNLKRLRKNQGIKRRIENARKRKEGLLPLVTMG